MCIGAITPIYYILGFSPFSDFFMLQIEIFGYFLFVWVYTRNTIGGAEPDVHCGYLVR